METERRRCTTSTSTSSSSSLSSLFYLDLCLPYIICTAFLVNRCYTCARRINTLLRLPKPARNHLLRFHSRLSTSRRMVNRFYMAEEPRDTVHTREEHKAKYTCAREVATTRNILRNWIDGYRKVILIRNNRRWSKRGKERGKTRTHEILSILNFFLFFSEKHYTPICSSFYRFVIYRDCG